MVLNFLEETMEKIIANGKTFEDIKYIVNINDADKLGLPSNAVTMSWGTFCTEADFEYENRQDEYGPRISPYLIIVGDGWLLKRVTTQFESKGPLIWHWKFEKLNIMSAGLNSMYLKEYYPLEEKPKKKVLFSSREK